MRRSTIQVISVNRKARHDYLILDTVEAGLVLTGTEIKSIREGRVNIRDSFARPWSGELWLMNAHVAQYMSAGYVNHEPTRPRKLLLHNGQLSEMIAKVARGGFTIVPLRIYIRNHVAKVEIGVARGRRQYDKRQVIAKRAAEMEMRRAIKAMRSSG